MSRLLNPKELLALEEKGLKLYGKSEKHRELKHSEKEIDHLIDKVLARAMVYRTISYSSSTEEI